MLVEDYNWDIDEIVALFEKTYAAWNGLEESKMSDMIKWCEETTGIRLANMSDPGNSDIEDRYVI